MEIDVVSWQQQRETLQHIRRRVFIEEQGIAEQDEWDDDDLHANHFLCYDGKRPVACARLLSDGTFGRLAVLPEHRQQGWGSRLLRALEKHAREKLQWRQIKASAQTSAYEFYRRNGYHPETEFYWDAGIAHMSISKVLARNESDSQCFVPGQDEHTYRLEGDAAAAGLVQLALRGGQRQAMLSIVDINQPLWRSRDTLDSISYFVRHGRQRRLQLLLPGECAGLADHPLMQLQQRLTSRFEARQFSGVERNELILMPGCHVRLEEDRCLASFSDRAAASKAREQFEEQWRSSQPLREAKRLRL
jgi:predicted GNAT family N-acyltransferase